MNSDLSVLFTSAVWELSWNCRKGQTFSPRVISLHPLSAVFCSNFHCHLCFIQYILAWNFSLRLLLHLCFLIFYRLALSCLVSTSVSLVSPCPVLHFNLIFCPKASHHMPLIFLPTSLALVFLLGLHPAPRLPTSCVSFYPYIFCLRTFHSLFYFQRLSQSPSFPIPPRPILASTTRLHSDLPQSHGLSQSNLRRPPRPYLNKVH